MLPAPPSPLHPSVPLRRLTALARPGELLGIWLRGRPGALWLGTCRSRTIPALLVSGDLGFLLRRGARVVVRSAGRTSAVEAEELIRWRVLRIVTSTPWLPPPSQLRQLYPELRLRDSAFTVPLRLALPEEVLAICAAERMPVVASSVEYAGPGGARLPCTDAG
jgi:hypothetical protein